MIKIVNQHKSFGGIQYRYCHYSQACQCDMNFSLYLPPQVCKRAVPVLTWLSGLTCSDENFVTKSGAQQFAAKYGVAILAPDTSPRGNSIPDQVNRYDVGIGAGFYLDASVSPWSTNYNMHTYICDELPLLLEEMGLNLDLSRQGIFGHSMGGHGALTIGLKHPERFDSISAFAPISSPMQCPWGIEAFKTYLGEVQKDWRPYDACYLIETVGSNIKLLVDQGSDDEFLKEQLRPELLVKSCNKAKVSLNLRYQNGYDHSYFFIASFIEDHIRHHSQILYK